MFSASSHLLPSVSSSSTCSQGRQQTHRPAGFSFYQVKRFLPAGWRIKRRQRRRRRGLEGGRGRHPAEKLLLLLLQLREKTLHEWRRVRNVTVIMTEDEGSWAPAKKIRPPSGTGTTARTFDDVKHYRIQRPDVPNSVLKPKTSNPFRLKSAISNL